MSPRNLRRTAALLLVGLLQGCTGGKQTVATPPSGAGTPLVSDEKKRDDSVAQFGQLALAKGSELEQKSKKPSPGANDTKDGSPVGPGGTTLSAFGEDSRDPHVLTDMAVVALNKGDLTHAEQLLRSALKVDPQYRAAQIRLVDVLGRQHRTEEIAQVFGAGKDTGPPRPADTSVARGNAPVPPTPLVPPTTVPVPPLAERTDPPVPARANVAVPPVPAPPKQSGEFVVLPPMTPKVVDPAAPDRPVSHEPITVFNPPPPARVRPPSAEVATTVAKPPTPPDVPVEPVPAAVESVQPPWDTGSATAAVKPPPTPPEPVELVKADHTPPPPPATVPLLPFKEGPGLPPEPPPVAPAPVSVAKVEHTTPLPPLAPPTPEPVVTEKKSANSVLETVAVKPPERAEPHILLARLQRPEVEPDVATAAPPVVTVAPPVVEPEKEPAPAPQAVASRHVEPKHVEPKHVSAPVVKSQLAPTPTAKVPAPAEFVPSSSPTRVNVVPVTVTSVGPDLPPAPLDPRILVCTPLPERATGPVIQTGMVERPRSAPSFQPVEIEFLHPVAKPAPQPVAAAPAPRTIPVVITDVKAE